MPHLPSASVNERRVDLSEAVAGNFNALVISIWDDFQFSPGTRALLAACQVLVILTLKHVQDQRILAILEVIAEILDYIHSGIRSVGKALINKQPASLSGPCLLQLTTEVEHFTDVCEVFYEKISVNGAANAKFWDTVYRDHKHILEMWLWCSKMLILQVPRGPVDLFESQIGAPPSLFFEDDDLFSFEESPPHEPLLIRRFREVAPFPLIPQLVANETPLAHWEPQKMVKHAVESEDGGALLFHGLSGERECLQSILDCTFEDLELSSFEGYSSRLGAREVRDRMRRILVQVAQMSQEFPAGLFLYDVSCRDGNPYDVGGFSNIYHGTYQGAKVAIKRLRSYSVDESEKRKAFILESLLWRHLNHEHILPFLGIADELFPGTLCMVTPWMELGNVRNYVLQTSWRPADKDHLFIQVHIWLKEISLGLAYLHEESIVHGDLRGANILISPQRKIQIADFGLAVFAEGEDHSFGSQKGGAYRWLAPELLDPESFGFNTSRPTFAGDIFSFACVCLELYTGQSPWSGVPECTALVRVIGGRRPGRPKFLGGALMVDEIWSLLGRCWEEMPSKRPTAHQLMFAISQKVDRLPALPELPPQPTA